MKIDLNIIKSNIEVGDVVNYKYLGKDYTCLIAIDEATTSKFPFRLVDLNSGRVLNAYGDMQMLDCYCTILAKHNELVLTKVTKEDISNDSK